MGNAGAPARFLMLTDKSAEWKREGERAIAIFCTIAACLPVLVPVLQEQERNFSFSGFAAAAAAVAPFLS